MRISPECFIIAIKFSKVAFKQIQIPKLKKYNNNSTMNRASFKKSSGITPQWPDSIKKKMKIFLVSRVRVLLYVIEADEFSYRCLISRNDGPARQSRNESPLFPKNIPSYILAYHSEGKVFSTCGFFHQIEEGLKAAPC